MKGRTISLKKIKNCLKLNYHLNVVNEPHPRSQVKQSLEALGILINLTKECFPGDDGWGWNLPKMHAFAKMSHNMLKFGSANNFSGNIGQYYQICYDWHFKSNWCVNSFLKNQQWNVGIYTGCESLCHDGVSTHRPVLSPNLEAAFNKIKVLLQ